MSLLTARQIAISYEAPRRGRRPLLAGLDLHVETGQAWLISGAHGSGKSCLLASLAGVTQLLGGALQVLGEPAGSRRAARAIGWAPEVLQWPGELRVQDALAEIAALNSAAALSERVSRVLQLSGLLGVARQRVARLSAGQARLLNLAQALLDDPPLLLIDGQLDALDAEVRAQLLAELSTRRSEGAAVLFTTHLPELFAEWASHELRLSDGVAHARSLGAAASAATESVA